MSMFDKKVVKSWKIKVESTPENKARFDKITQALKAIDGDYSFNIEDKLEESLSQILSKAEKELKDLSAA